MRIKNTGLSAGKTRCFLLLSEACGSVRPEQIRHQDSDVVLPSGLLTLPGSPGKVLCQLLGREFRPGFQLGLDPVRSLSLIHI